MLVKLGSDFGRHMLESQTSEWVESFGLSRELFAFPFLQAGEICRKACFVVVVSGAIDDFDCMEDGMTC
jgi:hypothetical protein